MLEQNPELTPEIKALIEKAQSGDADAHCKLGVIYEQGKGVAQSDKKAVEYFQLAAEQGDARAQCNLGVMYRQGKGVAQSDEKAVEYYRLAAEQGNANAQCSLGIMYEFGQGVAQSDEKAVEYYRLAAEQGNARGQCYLGVMYRQGKGVAQSDEKAVEYFQLAAEQGDARAQCNLGVMYEYGQGVAQSDEKAVEYYRLAAEQGNANAQCNLGVMYGQGKGVAQSDKKAVEYFQLAAEQGDARAQCNLGVMYRQGKGVAQSDEKAVEYYRLAAEQGNANAQCSLGIMYEFGQGVAQSDEKAVEYYRLAAEQGNARGQCYLGVMYRQGKGVAQSDEKAVEYFQLAAEQGDARAQCNLGVMYEYGQGVAQSDEKAVEYYRLAAEQGNANAQCNLGVMYGQGKGVAQSDEKAVEYFQLAAEQENARAIFILAYCYFRGKGITQSFTEAKALCEQVFKDPLLSFEAYELHDRAERFEQSKSISALREEILSHLEVRKNGTMTHYTAFDVGQAILLEKSPFRLGHINAVNDPNEGKLLWQELGYAPEEGNPVFIGCFLPDSDSLNMWRFYSKNHLNDDACGCAITFNTERFFGYRLMKDQGYHAEQNEQRKPSFANTGQSPQESAAFYRVVYLKDNFKILGQGAKKLQDDFKNLKKEVDKFVGKKPTPEKLQTLAWLLGPLPYLLKDANYKDEQEHRVIVTHLDYGAKEIKSEDPDFANGKAPRLYLELHRDDHLTPIEYVTLGPKAPNKEMMAPYWRHQLASKFESQLKRRKDKPLNINPSRCAYK
ncbi:SEL1-like repeat protein [Pseudoalteromonas sp. OANN1]|uniref:tetratricopeptide repeat protein n=1 Tax=Pseudoalteromonas sp. OANN1 TaxID=2954497 RepID=UPI002097B80F|nr:SEL1-like repeat protein [Pseudoalteromonas sp. OANN1]MCO7197720.1 SEL1-like repeat protein [Pseudoalteromonas sp. OANN1]